GLALEAPVAKKTRAKKTADATSIAARALASGDAVIRNLPPLEHPDMAPLRALLEDSEIRKTAQNAKHERLALRVAGVTLRGLDFDAMVASYVLDPGRRSHGLDVRALEFLNRQVTSVESLRGKGKDAIPFDQVPVESARDFACEAADVTWQLRDRFEP